MKWICRPPRLALPSWGLLLALLPACDMRVPDMGSILPSFSSDAAAGPAAAPLVAVPRGADALGNFAMTAQPGSVGSVHGEQARLKRAYHSASGRECREVILGLGQQERSAVACRDAGGHFVSSLPLLRGSLR